VGHAQVECDNGVGYIVDDPRVSTYDSSDPSIGTAPHPTVAGVPLGAGHRCGAGLE